MNEAVPPFPEKSQSYFDNVNSKDFMGYLAMVVFIIIFIAVPDSQKWIIGIFTAIGILIGLLNDDVNKKFGK